MFGVFLAFFLAGLLIVIIRSIQEADDKNPVLLVLMGGYLIRLFLRMIVRNLAFFSDGQTVGGGDSVQYEELASGVTTIWNLTGMHYVTTAEYPGLGQVPFVANLFAFVEYLNGGYSAIGNVSIVAFLACLTSFILYRCYVREDPERVFSFRMMCLVLFSFSFLAYTTDTYKDGILIFLVVAIYGVLITADSKNSWWLLPCVAACFFALNGTRFYLVYAMLLPVAVRLLGFQRRKIFNFGYLFFVCSLMAVASFGLLKISDFSLSAREVFENNLTNVAAHKQGMSVGSGVDIDGGEFSWTTYPAKILYTVFAPFPWESGSMGVHIAKIEMLLWWYVIYWAWKKTRVLLKEDPMMCLMFLVFIVGMTLAYSTTFVNLGLIFRQRLPIFFVASILAVWGRVAAKQKA